MNDYGKQGGPSDFIGTLVKNRKMSKCVLSLRLTEQTCLGSDFMYPELWLFEQNESCDYCYLLQLSRYASLCSSENAC